VLQSVGFVLYVGNLVVGAAAQTGRFHFGLAHHVLYFVVFAAAGLATLFSFHAGLLLTLGALALMPRARPGTWRHPALALVGLAGYTMALAGM
jgi:hypothetical protein